MPPQYVPRTDLPQPYLDMAGRRALLQLIANLTVFRHNTVPERAMWMAAPVIADLAAWHGALAGLRPERPAPPEPPRPNP